MAGYLEIERKFLVRDDSFKAQATGQHHIVQGYLCSVPERTVRVRIRDDRGFITVKGAGDACGASRFEWEMEIPVQDAERLMELVEPGTIDKTRYIVPCPDGRLKWEIDEFHGSSEGLTVAEIELQDESEPFDRPSWLGDEVTGNPRYYNSALSRNEAGQ